MEKETMRVPGSPEGVRMAAERLESFWRGHGLPPGRDWPFQVALDEALSNIVRHGLARRQDASAIEIEFRLVDREIEILVTDDAPPFDPLRIPEPDLTKPLEERAVGGLGIALVQRLMDVVEYHRKDGRNLLRLRRRQLEI
jgi:serine/threonine-protein kinase RsbW